MKKYILVLTIAFIFAASASAEHTYDFSQNYNFPDATVTEGKFASLLVSCNTDSGGECPENPKEDPTIDPPRIEICGNTVSATQEETTYVERKGETYIAFVFQETVDDGFGCKLSEETTETFRPFTLYDQDGNEVASGGSLEVLPILRGKYLNVDLNVVYTDLTGTMREKEPLDLYQLHLTDEPDGNDNTGAYSVPDEDEDGEKDSGYILVKENRGSQQGSAARASFNTEAGRKLDTQGRLTAPSLDTIIRGDAQDNCRGTCNDRTLNITARFLTTNNNDKCGEKAGTPEERCRLSSDNSGKYNYEPRGEILVGYPYPKDLEGYPTPEKTFYLCEAETPVENAIRYGGGDRFVCSGDSDWKRATECNDGIDNDNDFTTDHEDSEAAQDPAIRHDPGCESPTDDTGEGDNALQCGVNITEQYVSGGSLSDPFNGEKKKVVTKWKNEQGADYCVVDYVDTDLDYTDEEPEVFTCRDNPVNSETYPYATDLSGVKDYNAANDYCANLPASAFTGHSGTVKTVQFFASKSAMPLSSIDEEAAKRYITQEDSSGNYKFKNMFFQPLHSAETGYAPPCTEVFDSGGACGPGFDHEHDAQTWDYLSVQDTSDGYSQDEYIDSWATGNVSADNNEIYSHDSTTASSQAFPGGFAGKCSSPFKWVKNDGDRWKCALPSQKVTMEVNFVSSTQTKVVGSNLTGGITISDSEIQKWKQLHSYTTGSSAKSVPPSGNEYFSPLKLDALCFEGSKDENNEQIPDSEYTIGLTSSYTGSNGLSVITEEIPNNPEIDSNKYTCIYGFSQEITQPSSVSGLGNDRFKSEADSGREFIYEGVPPGQRFATNLDTVHGLVDWSGETSGSTTETPFKGYKSNDPTEETPNYRNPKDYYLDN